MPLRLSLSHECRRERINFQWRPCFSAKKGAVTPTNEKPDTWQHASILSLTHSFIHSFNVATATTTTTTTTTTTDSGGRLINKNKLTGDTAVLDMDVVDAGASLARRLAGTPVLVARVGKSPG